MKTLTSVVKALGEQPEESVTNQDRRQEAEERQCRGFLSPDPHPHSAPGRGPAPRSDSTIAFWALVGSASGEH